MIEVIATEMKRCQLLRVCGRVDSSTAPEFQRKLEGHLKRAPYRFVVNLHDLSFLSSAGLRTLLSASQSARRSGGDVRLSEISEQVARVLELTSMDSYFKCFPTDAEAVGSF